MKQFNLLTLSTFTLFFVFSFGCGNSDMETFESDKANNSAIESRSPDPNCEICDAIEVAHCCCYVENIESSVTSLDLHVCGVIGSNYGTMAESCSMFVPGGPPCTQVNNQGVTTILPYLGKLYFCIAENAPFSIYNANGSGDGRIRVGCSGSNMPQGSISENLDYLSGGYIRYFTTNGCKVQPPCPY